MRSLGKPKDSQRRNASEPETVSEPLLRLGGDLLELLDALDERAAEGLLLVRDDLRHALLVLDNLGEHLAEVGHHRGDEFLEETLLGAQLLAAEANGAAENAAEHVVTTLGAGRGAVGDREGKRANVVRDDAVRHVLLALILGAEKARVRRRPRDFLDLVKDGHEDVGVVV